MTNQKTVVISVVKILGAFSVVEQVISLLFVLLQEPIDQLREVLFGVLGDMSNSVEEQIVVFNLSLMEPGYGRPDRHMNSLHQLNSFTFLNEPLLVNEVDLLMC